MNRIFYHVVLNSACKKHYIKTCIFDKQMNDNFKIDKDEDIGYIQPECD